MELNVTIADVDVVSAELLNCDCVNCKTGVNSDENFIGHICNVDGCTQLFTTIQCLQEHIVCHQQKSFVCTWPDCGRNFAFSEVFKLHLIIHTYKQDNLHQHHEQNGINSSKPNGIKQENIDYVLSEDTIKSSASINHNFEILSNFKTIQNLTTQTKTETVATLQDLKTPSKRKRVSKQHIMQADANENCFTCSVCDKVFYRSDRLTKHMKIHSNIKDDKPPSKDKPHANDNGKKNTNSYNQNDTQSKVKKSQQVENQIVSYICTCSNCANQKNDPISSKQHICDVDKCGKLFSTSSQLLSHARVHASSHNFPTRSGLYTLHVCPCSNCKEKKCVTNTAEQHVCDFAGCGRFFSAPSHLLMHARVHSGERPFVCDFGKCRKSFSGSDVLHRHRSKHTVDSLVLHICAFDGCGKLFSKRSGLLNHTQVHTDEQSFQDASITNFENTSFSPHTKSELLYKSKS